MNTRNLNFGRKPCTHFFIQFWRLSISEVLFKLWASKPTHIYAPELVCGRVHKMHTSPICVTLYSCYIIRDKLTVVFFEFGNIIWCHDPDPRSDHRCNHDKYGYANVLRSSRSFSSPCGVWDETQSILLALFFEPDRARTIILCAQNVLSPLNIIFMAVTV